jgi:hypothetical protein
VLITTPYLSLPSPFLFFLTIEKGHPAAWMSFFYRESLKFSRHDWFKKSSPEIRYKDQKLIRTAPCRITGFMSAILYSIVVLLCFMHGF